MKYNTSSYKCTTYWMTNWTTTHPHLFYFLLFKLSIQEKFIYSFHIWFFFFPQTLSSSPLLTEGNVFGTVWSPFLYSYDSCQFKWHHFLPILFFGVRFPLMKREEESGGLTPYAFFLHQCTVCPAFRLHLCTNHTTCYSYTLQINATHRGFMGNRTKS